MPKAPVAPGAPAALSGGSVDALRALEASLGSRDFWNQEVLRQIPEEAVRAYQESLAEGRPSVLARIAKARALGALPARDRILGLPAIISGMPKSESLRRATAWAAGLPVEFADLDSADLARFKERGDLHLRFHAVPWLPEGLRAGNLSVDYCPISYLPRDLEAESLNISGCTGISKIPEGLRVRELVVDRTNLTELPEGLPLTRLCVRNCTSLRELPRGLHLEELMAEKSGLRGLPADLQVDWRLSILACKGVEELPSGLQVSVLIAGSSGLKGLPADLVVTQRLDISNTALTMLSDDEILCREPYPVRALNHNVSERHPDRPVFDEESGRNPGNPDASTTI